MVSHVVHDADSEERSTQELLQRSQPCRPPWRTGEDHPLRQDARRADSEDGSEQAGKLRAGPCASARAQSGSRQRRFTTKKSHGSTQARPVISTGRRPRSVQKDSAEARLAHSPESDRDHFRCSSLNARCPAAPGRVGGAQAGKPFGDVRSLVHGVASPQEHVPHQDAVEQVVFDHQDRRGRAHYARTRRLPTGAIQPRQSERRFRGPFSESRHLQKQMSTLLPVF
jgi:hypothetical protein